MLNRDTSSVEAAWWAGGYRQESQSNESGRSILRDLAGNGSKGRERCQVDGTTFSGGYSVWRTRRVWRVEGEKKWSRRTSGGCWRLRKGRLADGRDGEGGRKTSAG